MDILKNFDRWPTWMWANWEVAALADWLRSHNSQQPTEDKAGFYGLDVYSLWESMDVMMEYLEKEDPETAEFVQSAVQCFGPYQEDAEKYAMASSRISASALHPLHLHPDAKAIPETYPFSF